MSVLKPRNRLVYFRVSEDEFRELNHFRESMGARSISDLARSAMQLLLQEGNHHGVEGLSRRLSTLETVVADLRQKVEQMAIPSDDSSVEHIAFASVRANLQNETGED